MAKCLELPPTSDFCQDRQDLNDLIIRRDQLVEQRAAEKKRCRQTSHKPVLESLERHIRQLDAEIEAFDKLIEKSIEENEEFRHKNQLLQTVPGISKAISPVLVAMPDEAGKVSRRQIAALAGLAPFNHDSGTLKGHRAIAGGRRRVRRALYMAALGATGSNARLAEKYRQMRKDGKAGKVALIALARKIVTIINAMLKTNTSFQ